MVQYCKNECQLLRREPIEGTCWAWDGQCNNALGILDFLDNIPVESCNWKFYNFHIINDVLWFLSGDLCDNDIDSDGVDNTADNCPYLSNPSQDDSDGDGVGDLCETDSDGDGIEDKNDTCPFNPAITKSSFKNYFTVDLYPSLISTSPSWRVKDNEGEVMQTAYTGMPTMLIGMLTISKHHLLL